MKVSALALAAVAQVASAHYFFDTNIIGGAQQPAFKYVRKSTRAVAYNPIKFSSNPAADIRDNSHIDGPDIVCNPGCRRYRVHRCDNSHIDGPDIVCNQGAAKTGGNTQVLTVNAGEEIRLKLAVGAKFQHPGPEFVYLSKAPGSVQSYDGSGDWFKIHELGVCDGGDFTSTAWCDYNRDWVAAKIPKDTPNGEYLARFEHIGVHRSHVNQPEHYVSCLQIKVQGGGSGAPGPMVKFPGAYKASDPYANFSIYNGRKAFPMPGPKVWSGGNTGGSTGGSTPVKEAAPTTMATAVAPAPTAAAPPASNPPAGGAGCAGKYQQCGGQGFNGAKCCSAGTCKAANQWYSQCL